MGNLFDILICICVVILMIGAGMLIGEGTAESIRDLVGLLVYIVFFFASTAMASGMIWVLWLSDQYQARSAGKQMSLTINRNKNQEGGASKATGTRKKKYRGSLANNDWRGSLLNISSTSTKLIDEVVRFATTSGASTEEGIDIIAQKIASLNATEEMEIKRWLTVLVFECSPSIDRAVTLRRIKAKPKAKAEAAAPAAMLTSSCDVEIAGKYSPEHPEEIKATKEEEQEQQPIVLENMMGDVPGKKFAIDIKAAAAQKSEDEHENENCELAAAALQPNHLMSTDEATFERENEPITSSLRWIQEPADQCLQAASKQGTDANRNDGPKLAPSSLSLHCLNPEQAFILKNVPVCQPTAVRPRAMCEALSSSKVDFRPVDRQPTEVVDKVQATMSDETDAQAEHIIAVAPDASEMASHYDIFARKVEPEYSSSI